MTTSFFAKLEARVDKANSLLCIGLDPHVSQLPEPTAAAAAAFCSRIIDQCHPFAAAFKPNSAFFECFGPEGIAALQAVIAQIPTDIPIILDCKRGDIDTTASAYASAAYDVCQADCVTLSPYLGWDAIHPFVTGQHANKGAFVLCKTSNSSANELQAVVLQDGQLVYEKVADLVNSWNSSSSSNLRMPALGLVVGATDPIALAAVRRAAPDVWILCPGVGAQGGAAEQVCPAGLRSDGSGLLVSVSRALSKAENIAQAAEALRDDINAQRAVHRQRLQEASAAAPSLLLPHQRDFLAFALSSKALQFGSFTLKSGRQSPYFFNAGCLCSGHSLSVLGSCYAKAVRQAGVQFDVIFGPAYKGIPLAAALASAWHALYGEDKGMAYNRKEAKDHGEGGQLVGAPLAGQRVLIVDDVITAGTAIREAVSILQAAGALIVAVVVCLDRQEKASEHTDLSAIQQVSEEYGLPVHAIVQLDHLVAYAQEMHAQGQDLLPLDAMQAYRAQYGAH